MGILKKLGIALLVIVLVAVVAGYFLTRGDTADVAFDETVGTDPTLDEPEEESIPTVAIAEPVGWARMNCRPLPRDWQSPGLPMGSIIRARCRPCRMAISWSR